MAAKDREAGALPEGKAEKPKKKSRLKKIVILTVILVMTLGGAGLGAYWWLYMREPASGQPDNAGASDESMASGAESSQRETSTADNGADINSARIERISDLPRSGGMVLPLPNITVNLADQGGRRYLKLGMEVEVNRDVSAELKANAARIRDSIIMLLAGKTYGDISTPDGKVLLKAEIAARLNQILGEQRVVRVYLTDFVVE